MSKVTLNNKRNIKGEAAICLLCLAVILIITLGITTLFELVRESKAACEEECTTEYITEEMPSESELEPEVEVVENEVEDVKHCCDSPIHNYTEEEILLLACTVYSEAGNCSDEHQMYVASVIMNRVKSELYPDTIYEVIYQTKPCLQYACTKNGMIDKTMEKYNGNCTDYEFTYLENTYQNVLYVLENGSLLPENVIYQAEFKQGSGVYKKIGNTYFCYQ